MPPTCRPPAVVRSRNSAQPAITLEHSALRAVEERLIVSEARFRSLTQLSSNWYWQQDDELRFIDTTSRDNDRGGLTPQQHLGLCRWELPHTEPVGITWQEHRATLEARQPFHDLLLRRKAPDGRTHYVEVSGARIDGIAGRRAAPSSRPTRPAPPSRAS